MSRDEPDKADDCEGPISCRKRFYAHGKKGEFSLSGQFAYQLGVFELEKGIFYKLNISDAFTHAYSNDRVRMYRRKRDKNHRFCLKNRRILENRRWHSSHVFLAYMVKVAHTLAYINIM